MKKIIRLAAKSAKNRMFFDSFIKHLAISINVGDETLNRHIELPSYRGIQRRKEEGVIDYGSNHQAIGFDTPADMLSPTALNNIDKLLAQAAEQGLTRSNSRRAIADFIISHTDLTDCHLTALNEMMSLQ